MKNIALCGTCTFRKSKGRTYLLFIKQNGSNVWSFPKGHLEEGESFSECAVRETLEETGVVVELKKQLGPRVYKTKSAIKTSVFYVAEWVSGKISPQYKEISDAKWIDIEHLPKNIYQYHIDILELALANYDET